MRILVAPLDWGLGHATRCIPIVQLLLDKQCEVMIAGSGRSLQLLKSEFPSLKTFELPAYNPRYPLSGSMVWTMILQLPKFFRVIRAEHHVVEGIIDNNGIDAIISDNRYGCWSAKVFSVFITHQSNILMPRRFGWLGRFVKKVNEKQIMKFSRCWIPDHKENSLAGELVSFGKLSSEIKADHIGSLSRFKSSSKTVKRFDVLAIFSGPEPQRSLLEELLLSQLKNSTLSWFAVRGLPSQEPIRQNTNTADFLSGPELQEIIEASDVIIARSGYSTIMDLAVLGKKAIFIPTPGQTEQEYLAARLQQMQIAYTMPQNKFDLKTAMQKIDEYSGFKNFQASNDLLNEAVEFLMQQKYQGQTIVTTNFNRYA
jgi:uncharacterized protein (TIGR00661 family)